MTRLHAIQVIATIAAAASAGVCLAQDQPGAEQASKPVTTPAPTAAASPAPSPTPAAKPATRPAPTSTPPPRPPAPPDPTPTPVKGLEAVTTPSGLKYYDIKVGQGRQPAPGARVEVNYSGWLTDGTLFDSSTKRRRPFAFQTDRGVIAGWQEGIATMKVGGKRRLEIPSKLAYGEKGAGQRIPPGADLIFEIELLSIVQDPPQSVEGVEPVKSESGLEQWDLAVGKGDSPSATDRVRMHFAIWLEDGTLVMTSASRKQPYTGPTRSLLEGWKEALSTMKPGGKRRLYLPPELAFGDRPARGIPPNSPLIMEVELLEVLKPVPQTSVEGIEPVVTESGLKYWDIKVGEGASPEPTSQVRVHYTGWLTDGTMFDSSVERGEPVSFFLNRVIKGWTEGVGSMKVGGKRRLEIPSELGYGKRGSRSIPPDSVLIFEVELLGIE